MDTLYDIRDTIRDNLTTVAAVVLLAVISVGYFVLIFNTLLPGWQQNRALAAQVQAAQQSIRQAQQGNQDAPAVLQMQLETAASQLNTAADRFLSENQAAEILDNVYQYAALSGVEVANLQAVAPATTASPLVSERAFALQVNGRIPQLIGFIGRFQESTLPTVNLTDVSVTQLDAGAALSLVLRLYTSPIASGEALAAASEPIADPLLPAVTPTPAGAAALAAQLHQPWAAADWPAVITLIEQILAIDPAYPEMPAKLYAAYVNYGYDLAAAGDASGARAAFGQALARFPDGAEALAGLQQVTAGLDAPPAAPAGRTHIVSRGDTLFSIAKRYDVTVAAIQQANNLAGSTIYPGQTLTIP